MNAMVKKYLDIYNQFVEHGVDKHAAAIMTSHLIDHGWLSADEISDLMGVSRKLTDEALHSGKISHMSFGTRRVVKLSEMTCIFEQLFHEQQINRQAVLARVTTGRRKK